MEEGAEVLAYGTAYVGGLKITPLELTVRQLTGQTLPVRADTTDSVLELKVQIQTLTGLEPDAQCLVVEGGDGIALDLDHVTLGSCTGLKNGAMVHLTMQDASRHRREREQREASKAAAEAAAERARQAEDQAEEKAQKLSQIIAIGCVMMMGGGLIQLIGMWTLVGGWVIGLTGLVGTILQVWGWSLYMMHATRSKCALLLLGNLYVYVAFIGSLLGTFGCDLASTDKTWNERRTTRGWTVMWHDSWSKAGHVCPPRFTRDDFYNDIGGCGMGNCDDRYGQHSIDDCAAKCISTDGCAAISWADIGEDCHVSSARTCQEKVCTIYSEATATKSRGDLQVFCARGQPGEERKGTCVAVPFFAGYSTLIYLIAWCYILLEIRIRRKEIAALATAAAADSKTAAESHAAAGAKRGETELAATNP